MTKSSAEKTSPWTAEDFDNPKARMRAVPIIVLEKWEREGGAPGADYLTLTTEEIQRELVARGLLEEPQRPRGAGSVVGGFVQKQRKRNLAPPFVEKLDRGEFRFNLRDYAGVLREFRERFPIMGAGVPPPPRPEQQVSVMEERGVQPRSLADKILQAVQEYERDWQERLQEAEKEADHLSAKLDAVTEQVRSLLAQETRELRFVHTSPDFHDGVYGAKVTSIRETIGDMLKRARHSIRILTLRIDIVADELITLKRSNPDLEITVLTRGKQDIKGERSGIGRRAFDRMSKVGIKMPVEKELLHSRMVVIDEQEVLVSSADLDVTQMELEFNAGIWTNDPGVVAEAIRYFDNLLKL